MVLLRPTLGFRTLQKDRAFLTQVLHGDPEQSGGTVEAEGLLLLQPALLVLRTRWTQVPSPRCPSGQVAPFHEASITPNPDNISKATSVTQAKCTQQEDYCLLWVL